MSPNSNVESTLKIDYYSTLHFDNIRFNLVLPWLERRATSSARHLHWRQVTGRRQYWKLFRDPHANLIIFNDRMFEFITSFLSTAAPSFVPPPGPIVTVLIISANGAPPRIERPAIVNVRNDGNVDRFLHYVPDMRVYVTACALPRKVALPQKLRYHKAESFVTAKLRYRTQSRKLPGWWLVSGPGWRSGVRAHV